MNYRNGVKKLKQHWKSLARQSLDSVKHNSAPLGLGIRKRATVVAHSAEG